MMPLIHPPKPRLVARHLDRLRRSSMLALLALAATASWPAMGAEKLLRVAPQDVVLRGGRDELVVPLQLPGTEAVQRATLTIAYENALAVLPDGSRLTVFLNDKPLATLPMTAAQGPLTAQLAIPGPFLQPGLNRLSLVSELRHRVSCSRTGLGELWVKLVSAGTGLTLALDEERRPLFLSDLDQVLAASAFDGEAFGIVTPRRGDDEQALAWGGWVAEGVALRRGRPVSFVDRRSGDDGAAGALPGIEQVSGQNVAYIGTADELLPLVGDLGAVYDGTIMVRRLPADPSHLALIITGLDDDGVARAARTFADPAHAWPQLPSAATGAVRATAATGRPQPVLAPASSTPFSQLGYRTSPTPQSFTGQYEIPVDFPPTLYAGDGQKLVLDLNYAYRAGLASTSALTILVNGMPWNMVRLDREAGAIVEGKKVELPMGLFRPGRNTVGFEPTLHFPSDRDCGGAEDVALSLFDDSTVDVPPYASLALQPDIGRFADAAFPFGTEAPGTKELIVAANDPDTVSAAWTLIGRLAQANGEVLDELSVGFAPRSLDGNLLIVGPAAELPREVAQATPLVVGVAGLSLAPVPTAPVAARAPTSITAPASITTPAAAGETAREQWQQRLQQSRPAGAPSNPISQMVEMATGMAYAQSQPTSKLPIAQGNIEGGPRDAALMAVQSPYRADRTLVLLTARDPAALDAATDRLIEPGAWSRLSGGGARWNADGSDLVGIAAGEPYLLAPPSTDLRDLLLLGRTFLSKHSGYWLALSFGLLLTLGATMRWALGRRLENRL